MRPFLACASVSAFSLIFACSSTDDPTSPGAAGTASAAGNGSTAGSAGTSGATGSGGGTATAGAQGMAGTSSTAGSGTGGAGTAGSGAGGMSGGGNAAAGAGGGGGGSGPIGKVRTGMSAGCNKLPPPEDKSNDYVLHQVEVTGLDPVYLPGGEEYESSGKWSWSLRPFGVRLPANYDPSKPYAVTFGGGGCGGSAENFANGPGGGLQIAGNGKTLQVGLSYLNTCFHDGGPDIGNRTDTPDEGYFRAVMAQIEANYCIDLSQVFVGGFSSGAWEAYTLGCAASDLIRGIGVHEGGFRTMHPTCKGPVAAVLVAGEADTENPIGPLDPNKESDKGAINRLGSLGSAPGRDDILKRNGCVGTETEPYPGMYSACVKYKGCPANYPVIWCALPGVGHNSSKYNNVDYSPGPMWDVLGMLPPP